MFDVTDKAEQITYTAFEAKLEGAHFREKLAYMKE